MVNLGECISVSPGIFLHVIFFIQYFIIVGVLPFIYLNNHYRENIAFREQLFVGGKVMRSTEQIWTRIYVKR